MKNEQERFSEQLNSLLSLQKKFEETFSEEYLTVNSLPLRIDFLDRENKDKSNFFLSHKRSAVTYSSNSKTYFDSSFVCMVLVAPIISTEVFRFFENILIDLDDELLQYLLDSVSNKQTLNNCNSYFKFSNIVSDDDEKTSSLHPWFSHFYFKFSNIVPDDDEKTSSLHPWFCHDLNLQDSTISYENLDLAVNTTKIFHLIRLLIDPERPYMKTISKYNFIEDNSNDDILASSFVFISKKIISWLNLYIDYFNDLKNQKVNT